MKIHITKTENPRDYERITPNFIYNRFDLFCSDGDFEAVRIRCGRTEKIIEYRVIGNRAELGIWLTPVTVEELEALISYISKKHSEVELVTYNNGILACGTAREHNHFRIVFPDTVEEMESRISSKSRAKARKKLRFAEEAYGKAEITEYERSSIPDEVVEKFFEFKLATRGRTYDMTPAEYLDRYHVSHAYVLRLGDTCGAIRFSCEQCPVVYGENFTFNPELKDYSLGRYIFVHHLKRMVEKKHTELYFAGGDFEYKTHYGSIEETLYDCKIKILPPTPEKPAAATIKRSGFSRFKDFVAEHLPPQLTTFIIKVKRKLISIVRH